MKIEDLKEKVEDITPIEELTPEQKEMQEKFFRSAVVKRYKEAIKNLYYVMNRRKVTIDNIKKLILEKDKTLPFTASQRLFIMQFKDEFLVSCLKDVYKKHELYGINLTISEPVQAGTGDTRNVQSNS